MEDIVADDVVISDEEVIRSDAVTGAETRLTRFQVRTLRQLISADDALAGQDREGVVFAVNSKSGRAALVVQGLTTTNDDDRLIPAVRMIRPEKRSIASLKGYEESAWEDAGEAAWRMAWDAEIVQADPWISRELVLVSGLLLPIWSSLPDKATSVRRLKAPDGRRWLGRVLDPGQVPQLKVALGLTDTAGAFGDGATAGSLVLQEGASLALSGGLWLRRSKVMDRYRIEVVGAASQRAAFTALGCFVEIISYTARVFVPTDQPQVLTAVLAMWPVQSVLPAAA